MNTEQYIKRAKEIHGNKFDYSNATFVGWHEKVTITCPQHGDFFVNPENHIYRKSGCKQCAIDHAAIRYTDSTSSFIEKAKLIHGNNYDYSKVVYTKSWNKVIIFCNSHNKEFQQTPRNHLQGQKCPQCAIDQRSDKRRKPLSDFITDAALAHNNRYDYSLITETEYKTGKITIKCHKHGTFTQSRSNHLHSLAGCPKCSASKGELSIMNALESRGIEYETQKTFPDLVGHKSKAKLKYDFYIPSLRLLIEYDGIQHFIQGYCQTTIDFHTLQIHDTMKNEYAAATNIELIRIPYTEYDNINDIIQSVVDRK